jgi:hypothetical protein
MYPVEFHWMKVFPCSLEPLTRVRTEKNLHGKSFITDNTPSNIAACSGSAPLL